MRGSRLFLELLKQEGVTVLFGNPGTTELPLMDALAAEDGIRYVMALQEANALAMADGYARAAGRLGVVNLHVAPGFGNAFGMLFDAHKAGAPLLVTAGQQAQGFSLTEPNLYAELPPLAQPFVKWAVEVRRTEDLPRVIHRAAKVALAPPTGPVFVSLPTDVMLGEAEVALGRPSRVAPAVRGDAAAIAAAARLLAEAGRPLIVAGDAISQSRAQAELVALAELIGAPVHLEGETVRNDFPTRHPLFAGHLARAARVVRGVLERHDVVFSAGADLFTLSLPPDVEPVPDGVTLIHLDTDPWQLAKNYPTPAAILGDPKATLPELTAAIAAAMGDAGRRAARARREEAEQRLGERRAALHARADALVSRRPLAPLAVIRAIAGVVPPEAVVVDEVISAGEGLREFLACDGPDGYHGVRGGGIGWGLPGAVGVALAHPDRPVVALVGDGATMYSPQALWTAARENLWIVFVILVNRNYNILQQRLRGMRGSAEQTQNFVGMALDRPAIDYAGLARSLGVEAYDVADLDTLRERLGAGIAARRPVLLAVEMAQDDGR
ncbi:MAG TPA: thiamine pyrophosphate-binding protein [Hyphomicrobiales bacterium]|nr:thiamine pyrophosphate-binding protein [Hyphomicrobiales bacterium]